MRVGMLARPETASATTAQQMQQRTLSQQSSVHGDNPGGNMANNPFPSPTKMLHPGSASGSASSGFAWSAGGEMSVVMKDGSHMPMSRGGGAGGAGGSGAEGAGKAGDDVEVMSTDSSSSSSTDSN